MVGRCSSPSPPHAPWRLFCLVRCRRPRLRCLTVSSGYDQGVFSGIVGNADFLDIVGNPNDTLLGIIVSTYNLGCFTGCIVNFCLCEYLGRRKAMWFAMAWIIVSRRARFYRSRAQTAGRWERHFKRLPFRARTWSWGGSSPASGQASRRPLCPCIRPVRQTFSHSALTCPGRTLEGAQ